MNSITNYISEKIRNIAGNYINPSTEEKQDGIISSIVARNPLTSGGASLIGNAKTKWRFEGRDWGGASDSIWDLMQTGTGQTISVLGNSGGARYLNIESGTQVGETIIQSKEIFTPPFNFSYAVSLSQQIANQETHIELVEVDDNGNVIIDTELFTAPNFNNARSGLGIIYDGTTTTNAKLKIRSRGISEDVRVSVSFGTSFRTATGTTPNFFPGRQCLLSFNTDRIIASSSFLNDAAVRTEAARSTTYVPDPDGKYKIRIRVKNLATVTTTNVRFHFGRIVDTTRLAVDFGTIAGSINSFDAPPVYVVNPTSTSVTATIATPSTANGNSTHNTYVSTATVNNTLVKNSAGVISNIELSNSSASWRYLKLYNKATAPIAGTDTPVKQIGIPPNSTICTAFSIPFIRFATGTGFAITANPALLDNTAVGASEVTVSISYT